LYIDDISITVTLTSFRKNVEILEREATKLYELGAQNGIQFDLAKTELIYFAKCAVAKCADAKGTPKLPNSETIQPKAKCVDTKCALKLLNGVTIQPKELVRWLGVWFDSGLTFKQHVALRISQARSVFQRMTRLANTKKGLSPFALQ
jgi:hypothetical protein